MMSQDPRQPRPNQPYPYQGQPPQYPYQQQYPPAYQQRPVVMQQNVAIGGPRRAISRNRMSFGVEIFHWTMIICTCGLWTPVYLSGKRKRKTVTTYR